MPDGRPCAIADALEVIGERWALLVVRELLLGPDITITSDVQQPDVLGVDGLTAEDIGTIAWQAELAAIGVNVGKPRITGAVVSTTAK